MRKIRCTGWLMIFGITLLGVLAGCSSQLETTILSEKQPRKAGVVEKEEEPLGVRVEPVAKETQIGEQDLGKPAIDIPVEEPPRPVTRQPSVKEEFVSAPEELTETKSKEEEIRAMVSPEPVAPMPEEKGPVQPIPPITFDPQLPPEPTLRGGPTREVAALEPEVDKTLGKEPAVTPTGIPAGETKKGIPPILFDPEFPAQPTLRGETAEEVAMLEPEPVEAPEKRDVIAPIPPEKEELAREEKEEALEPSVKEEPLEVVKVRPSAPVVPLQTLADVYFDYDRFTIREDAAEKLDSNAQLLVEQLSGRKVVIEGHCDERGTRSYNMILGERRAQAVKKFLVDLGVPDENLEAISLGKERPFCTDHSLGCWQENRRGHFVLQ